MAENNHERIVDLKISAILNEAEQRIFERLDALHKQGIHDDDVITYLRKQGERDLAERYIEWGELIDPDGEPGPEDTSDAIPDPIDSPSYDALRKQTARTETF